MSGVLKTTDSLEDVRDAYLSVSELCFNFVEPLYRVPLYDVILNKDEDFMVSITISRAITLCMNSVQSRQVLVRIDLDSLEQAKKRCKQVKGYPLLTAISNIICLETFVADFEPVAQFIRRVRVLSVKYGINKQGYPCIDSIRVQKNNLRMPLVIKFVWVRDLNFDMMSELKGS